MTMLIYKRTHVGDPDEAGVFGCNCCMGQVRDYKFDAVIGVGGIGSSAKEQNIKGKITWIGLESFRVGTCICGHAQLAFKHFVLFDSDGELLKNRAPALAKRFCHSTGPRYIIHDYSDAEKLEIKKLIAMAKDAPPSPGLRRSSAKRKRACSPKRQSRC